MSIGRILMAMLLLSVVGITACKKEEEAPVQVKPVKKVAVPVQAQITTTKKYEYVYDPTGKRDPFKPFIELSKKAAEGKGVPMTPLQSYEIAELRLVGVIILPGKKVAMIEDPTGKGYSVKEGALIGKNDGRIVEIAKDEVLIEERYVDEMARTKTRKVSMRIPKAQGGEDR